MLCVKSAAALTAFQTPLRLRRNPANLRQSPFSVRMSSSSSANPKQIIEHIVLFKAKPEADLSAMLSNLNSLVSLDSVLHLSAGPVSRCRCKSGLNFTHMLHSRYLSKQDLDSYTVDPAHVSVVTNFVKPVVDDVMAVDWVADDLSGPAVVSPGSALRLTVLKVKEESEKGKEEVLGVLKGVKDKLAAIEQLTVGENFSPGRAKGFSICSIAVFKGTKELEGLESESEVVNEQKDKAREFLDGVLVVDYVVGASASPAAASL